MTTGTVTVTTTKYLGYMSAFSIFEYLNIPQTQICILGILMVFDFASGIAKQFRIDKTQITSHRAWLGAMKKGLTMLLIFSVALIFKSFEMCGDGYIKGLIGILTMAEFYSIIQNIYTVRTGVIVQEFDAISILIKTIGDFVKEKLEKYLKVNQ